MTTLAVSWNTAWQDLALAPPEGLLDALLAAWAQPQRRYHTQQHLRECLVHFAGERALARHPGEVALALWFHDAVYDLHRSDNEAASAEWSRQALRAAGATEEVVARVHALVMATCHDHAPTSGDERLLVDIDLAILGSGRARFAEYERQIREEYAFVPEPVFRAKRREVLRGFEARAPIYATAGLRARLEAAAHANLGRALSSP